MNIRLSISKQFYKKKPTRNYDIPRMRFEPSTMSLNTLTELIRNGYCYTHIFNTSNTQFNMEEKTVNNFKCTNIVCLDVDNGNKPFNEFVEKLTYIPTIAYTSPSNDEMNQLYKFRLVYVFNDTINNAEHYESIYWNLVKQMENDNDFINNDNRVKNVSYYFNGSYGCDMINNLDKIYNINDFKNLIKNNNVNNNCLYINLNETKSNINKISKNTKLTKDFINDLNKLEPFKFIQKYKNIYPIFERTDLNFENGYAVLDNDFIEIKRKWTWGAIETENGLSKLYTITKKIKDGQGRRYHIGLAAMIRRKILSSITLEHLIVNAVYDRQYYFDNSDGVLTNKVLIERCNYVMNLTEINIESYNKKKFMVDKQYWQEQGINANQAKMIVRKQINYEMIGSWYDTSKSVNENYKWSKENGVKVGRATLYRFCNDNNINTNPNKGTKRTKNSNTEIKETEYIESIKDNRNLELINELNEMYNNKEMKDNKDMKEKFLNNIEIMTNKLSNINDINDLNKKYETSLEWIDKMFNKYNYNLSKESIINEITNVYENTMKKLNPKEKGGLLYRIQTSQYNSNELYNLIGLLQDKIKTNFYINDLLIEYNENGYPWELIANRQIEYVVTAA